MAKSLNDLLGTLSPAAKESVISRKKELLRRHPLGFVRSTLGLLQQTIAEKLGVSQAAVSKMEGRNDFILSTLHAFVEATGGKLVVRLDYDQKSFGLVPDQSGETTGFVVEDISIEPKYAPVSRGWSTSRVAVMKPPKTRLISQFDDHRAYPRVACGA